MSDVLQLLTWDTRFFGMKIGRVLPSHLDAASLEAIIRLADRERFQCLYFQAEPDDDETVCFAERGGFHLVDVRVVLEHPFDGRPAPVPRFPISEDIRLMAPRPEDVSTLEDIAVEIGHTSRFCVDRNFPPDACSRLYRAWFLKAMADDHDSVITAYLSGRPVGLIACGTQADKVGVIQLAGVQSGRRGRGVGTALVQGALDWFRAQGVQRAEVTTQARNVPAQRLYQQMGFFTCRMNLYYHKWMDE
jgi:ribosomal protein S18 acetylase RimI-like enzyme